MICLSEAHRKFVKIAQIYKKFSRSFKKFHENFISQKKFIRSS
jgi:hypothetical protein